MALLGRKAKLPGLLGLGEHIDDYRALIEDFRRELARATISGEDREVGNLGEGRRGQNRLRRWHCRQHGVGSGDTRL